MKTGYSSHKCNFWNGNNNQMVSKKSIIPSTPKEALDFLLKLLHVFIEKRDHLDKRGLDNFKTNMKGSNLRVQEQYLFKKYMKKHLKDYPEKLMHKHKKSMHRRKKSKHRVLAKSKNKLFYEMLEMQKNLKSDMKRTLRQLKEKLQKSDHLISILNNL